eukprot:CAMPEP_0197609248 /NCGR_PEP_ID=MMETSP1326-20131121/50756_1 /TAXON_ID=1155430 /ORGANISM="Genus nov. species nov., Strain RCC2288" /LENGTH=30 /DNA_ID= /DNA_START= /DNA_END= /DNA_ORIENTATION=
MPRLFWHALRTLVVAIAVTFPIPVNGVGSG